MGQENNSQSRWLFTFHQASGSFTQCFKTSTSSVSPQGHGNLQTMFNEHYRSRHKDSILLLHFRSTTDRVYVYIIHGHTRKLAETWMMRSSPRFWNPVSASAPWTIYCDFLQIKTCCTYLSTFQFFNRSIVENQQLPGPDVWKALDIEHVHLSILIFTGWTFRRQKKQFPDFLSPDTEADMFQL